jgi:hypothetical protein
MTLEAFMADWQAFNDDIDSGRLPEPTRESIQQDLKARVDESAKKSMNTQRQVDTYVANLVQEIAEEDPIAVLRTKIGELEAAVDEQRKYALSLEKYVDKRNQDLREQMIYKEKLLLTLRDLKLKLAKLEDRYTEATEIYRYGRRVCEN